VNVYSGEGYEKLEALHLIARLKFREGVFPNSIATFGRSPSGAPEFSVEALRVGDSSAGGSGDSDVSPERLFSSDTCSWAGVSGDSDISPERYVSSDDERKTTESVFDMLCSDQKG